MHRGRQFDVREAPSARRRPGPFKPVTDRLVGARRALDRWLGLLEEGDYEMARPCGEGVFGGPFASLWPRAERGPGCPRCENEPARSRFSRASRPSAMGDSYLTPERAALIDEEARTGAPADWPLAGSARGSEGFDAVWIDLERQSPPVPMELPWEPDLGLPFPFLFDALPEARGALGVESSIQAAAARLGTLFVSERPAWSPSHAPFWVPRVGPDFSAPLPRKVRLVELDWDADGGDAIRVLRELPGAALCARVPLNERALSAILTRREETGARVFHLAADYHGRERGPARPRFMAPALLELHEQLTRAGVRDELTLIASGGVARPEHAAKALLCGADLVALDLPLLSALHAEFLGEHPAPEAGRLRVRICDPEWGAQRLVNLCAAWSRRLGEIAAGLGVAEARRLRSEAPRLRLSALERERETREEMSR